MIIIGCELPTKVLFVVTFRHYFDGLPLALDVRWTIHSTSGEDLGLAHVHLETVSASFLAEVGNHLADIRLAASNQQDVVSKPQVRQRIILSMTMP